jgi:hypothetical protein
MAYKVLTKQQWDSLPAYKKNQMRARTPDLYNYYQDRYVTKAEPVAEKRSADGTFNPNDSKAERVDKSDITAFLNDYYGQNDPTGQNRIDDEYYDTLPQEMQWLIEDQAEFASLVKKYLKGDITYEELQEFELSDYGDAGTKFVEFYEEMQTRLLPTQEASPTPAPVSRTIDGPPTDEQRALAYRLFAQNNDRRMLNEIIEYDKEAAYIKETSESKEGTEDPEPAPYKLPENEEVDVTELTEEQQTDIWDKIKEGLGKIPGAVGKVIFGPDGMPTNVDEWIEWVDKTLQAQMGPENLPFPIVITTNPQEGTWIDLKIPVNFDVNGSPIRIPLFDEDGNFVSSEELGKAWVDAKGQILGPLGEIGEIFLDDEGNIKLDLGKLKDVLLEDLTLNPDGSITGSTVGEILIGKWFFNPDSGEWEEEVEASLEEVGLDDGDEDGLADTTDGDTTASTDDDELGGLFEEEDEDEDPTPPTKAPRGNLITDKDGNPIRIIGTDGTNYVLDGDGQWVVAAVGEGDGGETVLPGTTTVETGEDDGLANDIDVPADPVNKLPDDIEEVEIFEDSTDTGDTGGTVDNGGDTGGTVDNGGDTGGTVDNGGDTGGTVDNGGDTGGDTGGDGGGDTGGDNGGDTGGDTGGDNGGDGGGPDDPIVVTNGGDNGGDGGGPDDPIVVTNGGDNGGDGGGPDDPIVEDPLVGTDDPIVEDPLVGTSVEDPLVGTSSGGGGGGGGKRGLESGGYMGGLSYNLPGFVGVQYQPKDYTVELNRIINESLFKGMI